jgi:hypothetical protein
MGGHVLTELLRKDFFQYSIRKNILIAVFILSFIFIPSRFVLQTARSSIDKEMHDVSIDLQQYGIRGNIASNREYGSHDAWHKTFRLAYWLKSRYYGQAGENYTDEILEKELRKYDIDYYFIWGTLSKVPVFLPRYKEVTNGEIPDLRIFSLREKI